MVDSERPVPFDEQVGLALRAYRREHGQSQRAFADEVEVPPTTVARLERSALSCSPSWTRTDCPSRSGT